MLITQNAHIFKRRAIAFLAYGCLGITAEVFFTAIRTQVVGPIQAGEAIGWDLQGQSYIWMLPIYGLAAFFWPPIYRRIARFPLIVRLLMYAAGIFAVEFVTGFILEQVTGHCPWDYTGQRTSVLGYIRLDYTPGWMAFGFLVEQVHLHLSAWLGYYGLFSLPEDRLPAASE